VRGYPTHLGYAAIPDALSSEEASAVQPVPRLEAPPQPRRTPFDSAMNVVLQSTDRVLIESVRLALGAEGIDVVLNDESGAALPFVPVRVLVSSADFARAREIVRDLVPTAAASVVQPSARRIWNLVLLALVALLLVLCGNLLIG